MANTTMAAFWTVYELISDEDLLQRARERFEANLTPETQNIDIFKVSQDPLLQSVFAEVLRLRTLLLVLKYAQEDVHLGKWTFPKGSVIAMPTQARAMDTDVWNSGTLENPHPLDKFWAERFLVYPQDPSSGPLRPKNFEVDDFSKASDVSAEDPDDSNEPIFSLEGLTGSYFPFSGGHRTCPGRNFSKQEALSTAAHFLLKYDIEVTKPLGWTPGTNMAFFPTGVLPPGEAVPFRMLVFRFPTSAIPMLYH